MVTTRSALLEDLVRLDVGRGDLLMVHASIRSVGRIVGGVNVLAQAMFDAIGPEGTLSAYVDFEPFYEDDDDPAEIPVFDKRIAHAARDHGILHETLRNWPGALRSDHPDAGVVAIGPQAGWITGEHPFQYGYGEGSPFEKIVQAQGRVLLIGAPLDTITLLHYAEHKANIPNKRIVRYRRRVPGEGGHRWVDFEEFDTAEPVSDALPANCFERIASDFLACGFGRRGRVGAAESFLFEAPELIGFGIQWLERFFP
ncbi:aminoglycoside 3-N-acetyltransferase [Gloeobacter violaceus]|uniref:Aminoglycoside N(3)-acetyltransferase n=1 Tax=Gloeobacter violaceus (strain ATCC 29082 / PCC 7421) TaxID=251221 RepID=Q7NNC7_GLOVI|nr:aminoglycoside 3-N-acetyltransferase [Gloeobacter violaceus]BAC88425.1 aminoglycoside N3'-acetyltransferase [Gloeobacter violaceus PCC 7421]